MVTALLEHIDHRILARQMSGANRDHDRPWLGHSLLDPPAPIGVAALDQRLLKTRRRAKVAVETGRDRVDVAARPGAEHFAELGAHILRLIDRALQKVPLGTFGQAVEEAELLHIAL